MEARPLPADPQRLNADGRSTWKALTEGLSEDDLALFTLYRDFCHDLPEVEEQFHKTQVQYARTRIFTSAYIKSHYLEIGVELLREATHPQLPCARRGRRYEMVLTSGRGPA